LGYLFEDRAQITMQRGGDLPRLGPGVSVIWRADGFGRLVALLRAPERLGEPLHLATVDAGDFLMKVRDVRRGARQPLRQLVLLRSSSRSRIISGRCSRRPRRR
jgi:hypothetical protein